MGPHVAAIGMRFYTGTMFPPDYRHAIYIAHHGSWNRSQKSGYRVMAAFVEGNKVVKYEPFVTGWLQGRSARGRPADVEVMADGALPTSHEEGEIYRVSCQR